MEVEELRDPIVDVAGLVLVVAGVYVEEPVLEEGEEFLHPCEEVQPYDLVSWAQYVHVVVLDLSSASTLVRSPTLSSYMHESRIFYFESGLCNRTCLECPS